MNTFKSIRAGVVGIVVGAALSIGTDSILKAAGLIPADNLYVSAWIIWAILAYRTVYNILGCYLAARLAPRNPFKHAIVLGVIGTIVSSIGAIASMKMNLGPAWYAWTLAALSLPAAWVGGVIYLRQLNKKQQSSRF